MPAAAEILREFRSPTLGRMVANLASDPFVAANFDKGHISLGTRQVTAYRLDDAGQKTGEPTSVSAEGVRRLVSL